METIHTILQRAHLKIPRPMQSRIGQEVAKEFRTQFGRTPQKVQQKEVHRTYLVNAYPESFQSRIHEIILEYLAKTPNEPNRKVTIKGAKTRPERNKRKRIQRKPVKV